MLLSNSPVKNIVERLNPFSQKNKISRLKFERKSDYKTFLKFIKDNTKEIKDIEIPDSEDKKNKGLMIGGGILGLALLGTLGRGKRDSDGDGTGKLQSISGVIQKAKTESRKVTSGGKTRRNLDTASDVIKLNRKRRFITKKFSPNISNKVNTETLNTGKIFDAVKNEKKIGVKQEQGQTTTGGTKYRNNQRITTTESSVGGNTTGKSTAATATIDDFINADDPFDPKPKESSSNQGKQGPTGGTRGRIRGGKDKFTDQDFKNLQIDQGAEEQIKEAEKIKLQDKLKIKSDIRRDRQEKANRASNVLDDFEADSARRAAIEDAEIKKEIKKTRSKIDKSKFFDAPDIPKRKKLSGLDKFNRFSSNIFNNPFVRLTSSVFGFIVNAKGEILRTTLTPTQLGPTDEEERRLIEQFSDKPVNIFLNNGNQSMLPFDTGVSSPSTSESNGLISSTNDFFENTPNLSIEDLFFIKMEGT